MALSTDIARVILDGFDKHYRLFRQYGADAKTRFEQADWLGGRRANRERTEAYDVRVREAVEALNRRFPTAGEKEALWPRIKQAYITLLYGHFQPECAETFFNSVACRVLHRRYYNNEHIFWRPAVSTEYLEGSAPPYRCHYPGQGSLRPVFEEILRSYGLSLPFRDLNFDLDQLCAALDQRLPAGEARQANFQVQVLTSLFYRNQASYLVGRVLNGGSVNPFLIPLLQDEQRRLYVDTVVYEPRHVGRVFSLARAYFMVDMEVPAAYVSFLSSLLPGKPKAELYTVLGLQKQGKTLLYRDLHLHLRHSTDRFVVAPGTRGMVMLVFTLPSFPYVFKVIRDHFAPPKETDPKLVQEKYLLVKHHDRVGRMSDTLEYSDVAFPLSRIDPSLRDELDRLAPSRLTYDGDQLVISHLYVERRLVPLDVYLEKATEEERRRAIVDYGNALKDLAAANIFPGDLLLKNFGLTRYGRVVFYDYDEISYLTDCNFRFLPKASSEEEELSAEPFFAVGPRDVFPEQFPTFVFPEGPLRNLFLECHPELVDPRYWAERQERLNKGALEEFFPYPVSLRFRH